MRLQKSLKSFAGEKLQHRELAGFALGETVYPAGLRMPRHGHEPAYITLVLQGGYDESVGAVTRNCKPSTLVFHPAGEEHAITFQHEPVRIFRLEAKPAWLTRVREHSNLFDAPAAFACGPPAQLALRLYRESHANDAAAPLAIEGLVLEILAAATRQTAQSIPRASSPPPRWLQHARELLQEQWAETPALSAIAREVGVHSVSLARAFRHHFQCSIGDYVRRLRIEHACRQIAQTNAPLIEIAHAVGFYDQSHFSRTFKRYTGLTPAEYRATHTTS